MNSRSLSLVLSLVTVACSSKDDPAVSVDAAPDATHHHEAAPPDASTVCEGAGPTGDELVFVGHGESTDVRAIDPRACAVVATIPIGATVSDATASADGKWVFFSTSTNEVVVIDVAARAVKTRVAVGTKPVHVFGSPDHTSLWVANDGSANVSVIDLATLSVARTVATGVGHHKMAMVEGSPYRAYVSNITDATITPVANGAAAISATIKTNPGPHGMDWSSVGKKVLNCSAAVSGDAGAPSPAAIDVIPSEGAGVDTVTKRIELSARCNYLTVAPDGRYAWASVPTANALVVVDATTDTIVATIPVGAMPDKIRFFAGDLVGTGNVGSAEFSIVDMKTHSEVAKVPIGVALGEGETSGHRAIAPSRDGGFAYAVDAHDGTLSIVDVGNKKLRGKIAVGAHPMAIAVAGPSGGVVYPR
ncbi:MAG: YVTN family beta-propeller repeat protein [Polyangiales bacterium]